MACLYIDELKSHFPKIEPSILRAKPNEKWCPQILLESLGSQTSDDYYISEEFTVRNAAMNFLPKVPKIFAIGLRLDRENIDNASVSQCWNIDTMKTFLKQYFSIIRSYQNYFCASWKSDPKETIHRSTHSFVSFESSMISECPAKLEEKSLKVQKADCIMMIRGENDSLHDVQISTKQSYDHERVARQPEKSKNETIVTGKMHDRKSNCTMTSAILLSSKEENDRRITGHTFHDDRTSKSKRHVSIQTVERQKSRHGKFTQCHEQRQKETSSSKDVETIFAANSENFNREKSNVNLELLRTRHTGKGSKVDQQGRTEKRSKRKHAVEKSSKRKSDIQLCGSTSTKENIFHLTNSMEEATGKRKRRFLKKKGREPMKNVVTLNSATSEFVNTSNYMGDNLTTIYKSHNNNNTRNESVVLIRNEHYDIRRILGTKVENRADPSGLRLYSTKPSGNQLEAKNTLWGSRNYSVEDKSSELTILGNVKKRLEEDYDDYFSLKDTDMENDLFVDAKEPDSLTEICPGTVEENANYYTSLDQTRRARSMLTTSLTKHGELQQELRERSFRSSLTRCASSSMQILNTGLQRMERSNCHGSLRDQECSPSSSIEYCTASSLSLTNLQSSSGNDSVSMLFQSCSVDTRVPSYDGGSKTSEGRYCFTKDTTSQSYDGGLKASEARHCFSNDTSLEENEVFQDTRDFLDRTLIDAYTVRCYQRNSTPKFTNSSKLVTESLDSGILTDCSHGGRVRILSDERFREMVAEIGGESENNCERQTDLLPTYDFDTDSSYSDESLDRRVDVAVRKFTENLILGERRARNKLQRMENPMRHRQERKRRKKGRQVKNVPNSFPKGSSTCVFETSPRYYDDDWLVSSSTPPLYSFSDSEMDHL